MALPYGRVDFSLCPPPQWGGIGRLVRVLEINFLADFLTNLGYFCQFAPKIFSGSIDYVEIQYAVMIPLLFLPCKEIFLNVLLKITFFCASMAQKPFLSISAYPPPPIHLNFSPPPNIKYQAEDSVLPWGFHILEIQKNQYCHLGGPNGALGSFWLILGKKRQF